MKSDFKLSNLEREDFATWPRVIEMKMREFNFIQGNNVLYSLSFNTLHLRYIKLYYFSWMFRCERLQMSHRLEFLFSLKIFYHF